MNALWIALTAWIGLNAAFVLLRMRAVRSRERAATHTRHLAAVRKDQP